MPIRAQDANSAMLLTTEHWYTASPPSCFALDPGTRCEREGQAQREGSFSVKSEFSQNQCRGVECRWIQGPQSKGDARRVYFAELAGPSAGIDDLRTPQKGDTRRVYSPNSRVIIPMRGYFAQRPGGTPLAVVARWRARRNAHTTWWNAACGGSQVAHEVHLPRWTTLVSNPRG